jgi:hypothetical protein
MSAKQKGLTCLKYADPPTTITGVAHRWGGGGGVRSDACRDGQGQCGSGDGQTRRPPPGARNPTQSADARRAANRG